MGDAAAPQHPRTHSILLSREAWLIARHGSSPLQVLGARDEDDGETDWLVLSESSLHLLEMFATKDSAAEYCPDDGRPLRIGLCIDLVLPAQTHA